MGADWYCRIMGEEWGPMSSQELMAVARRGRLTRDDNVRRGLNGTWVRAEIVRGLFNSSLPVGSVIAPGHIVAAVKSALPAKRSVRSRVGSEYWFRVGTKVLGPFSGKQLQQLAEHGLLKPFHLVSNDRHHWVRASLVRGLAFESVDRDANTQSVRSAVWLEQPLVSPDAPTAEEVCCAAGDEALVNAE